MYHKAKATVIRHRIALIIATAAILIGSVLTGVLLLQKPAPASSGNIYAAKPTQQIKTGNEVLMTLRINPGAEIDTVTASITYDKSALSYDKATYTDSPFSSQIPVTTKDNTITVQSAKLGGQTVASDSLIATLRFVASKDNPATPVLIYGNAARAGIATNPTVMGETADESKNPLAAPIASSASGAETSTEGKATSPVLEPIVGALKAIGIPESVARGVAPWFALASILAIVSAAAIGGFFYYRHHRPKLPKGEKS